MKVLFKYKKNILFFLPIFILIAFLLYQLILFFLSFFLQEGLELKKSFDKKEYSELLIQNQKLVSELEVFKESKKIINFLELENLKLKKKLNYQIKDKKLRENFPVLFNKDSNIFSSILILDPEEKTKKDDLVFVYENFLIGKISGRISNISKIKLFSFLGEKNNFFIQDGGKEKIRVEGIGDGSGIIKVLAPRNFNFKDEKKVFLVYENNSEYIVGHLVDIQFKNQDINKVLFFKIFANPTLLNQLEIQSVEPQNPITVNLE
jgi:hypothetical protein